MSSKKSSKSKKSGRRSDCEAVEMPAHFSAVPVSPAVRGSPGGQLTGLPRKIKDTCADWHNSLQEWEALNTKGMQYATDIANKKVHAGSSVCDEDGESVSDLSIVLPPGLEDVCQQLKTVYLALEKLVLKFETYTSNLAGVAKLEKSQNDWSFSGSGWVNTEPLFHAWPAERFCEEHDTTTSQELLAMYRQELEVKKTIVENIAHSKDRDTLMFYTSVWLHEAYTDHSELLEAMLVEVGLR